MFDVYLQSKQPNRKSQRLLALASVLSTVATAAFLVVLWLQGKMGINMVDPPTIEFVLVQLTDVDAAPPPPPPPPPAGDTSEEEEEEVPGDDLAELTQPKETSDKLPEKKKGPKGAKSRARAASPAECPEAIGGRHPGWHRSRHQDQGGGQALPGLLSVWRRPVHAQARPTPTRADQLGEARPSPREERDLLLHRHLREGGEGAHQT